MIPAPAFTSEDIQFQPISTHDARVHWSKSPAQPGDANVDPIYQSCGTTLQVENATYQNRGRSVCVLWNRVPERLVLGAGKRNVTYRFLMAVDGAEAIAQTEFETGSLLERVKQFQLKPQKNSLTSRSKFHHTDKIISTCHHVRA